MAVYLRGKNYWFDFAFKGHRVRESIGPFKKRQDALKVASNVMAKRRVEIIEGKVFDKKKMVEAVKFSDFAVTYMTWSQGNKAKTSYNRDKTSMRRLREVFGNKLLSEIRAEQIEDYRMDRQKVVGVCSVNRELALLKHTFTKATEWKRVEGNPTKTVKLKMKDEIQRIRFLTADETQRLLDHCPDNLRPIVLVALHTGARREEILSLTWPQVNQEAGTIYLPKTKNHEPRHIRMNQTVRAVFDGLTKRGQFVFCKENGGRYTKVPGPFEDVVRRAEIEDFHFHDLRHTFASNLVMKGVSLLTIKELLGHKKLDMTLRYAHLAPNFGDAVFLLDAAQISPQFEGVSARA